MTIESIDLGFLETKGILVKREGVRFLRLPMPVLVADAQSWALASCDILSEEPDRLTPIDRWDACERDLREQIEDLEAWGRDPAPKGGRIGNSPLHACFLMRQRLMPGLPAVRRADQIPGYAASLVASSISSYRPRAPYLMADDEIEEARRTGLRPHLTCAVGDRLKQAFMTSFPFPSVVEWVLFIEETGNRSILYAVKRLRSAVRHTGNCIDGVLASGEDELYARAADHVVSVAARGDPGAG